MKINITRLLPQEDCIEIEGATLLSDDEADEFKEFIFECGLPWFLRSPMGSYPHFSADYQTFDTVFDFDFIAGIRLALKIKCVETLTPGTKFTIKGYVFTVLSDTLALSDAFIDFYNCENEDFDEDFDYEKSNLKKHVDECLDILLDAN